MVKRKSYTTSQAIADELFKIAEEMGVPESSIINFALKEFIWNYRRNESEKNKIKQIELEMAA